MTDYPRAPPSSSAAGPSTDDGRSAVTTAGNNSAPRRLPKKRTKTGCLTCRKRRIKCGEEKPTCSNCLRSKRVCEGYVQRVIFKNPMGISGVSGPPQDQHPQQQHVRVPLFNEHPPLAQQAAAAIQHPMLSPRTDVSTSGHQPYLPSQMDSSKGTQIDHAPQFYYPTPPEHAILWSSQTGTQGGYERVSSTTTSDSDFRYSAAGSDHSSTKYQAETVGRKVQADINWANSPMPGFAPSSMSPGTDEAVGEKSYISQTSQIPGTVYYHQQPPGQPPLHSHPSNQFQSQPQVIYVDETEDYYDVESDEEMADQTQEEGHNQLSLIMASANHDDGSLRSFTTHLNEPNILATYYPTLGSSPLNNPKTVRIFAHFIHSTGPSLSIFERHPTDPSIALGSSVPPAQQGLWTYTLPLKALEHPALLQAILAVSSLHIAYLQGVPSTVSLKHYHYALKRIGRAVGLPLRRKQIGTLAATELLAYYEVISADHSKWNSHVAGAAQLIKEIDFASTTRDLRAHRRRAREQRHQMGWSNSMYHPAFDSDGSEDDPFAEKEGSVDEAFLSSLLGRMVDFDEFGLVNEGYTPSPKRHFTRKDIENFRIQCDLYWWFTKQDVFHSLVSGDKLFMPYYLHGQCPPRAGVGRIDAIYGSADHLWLLLARVSDFGYRDRRRKLRALRAGGTAWRPGPGLFKFMGRFAGGDANKRSGSFAGSRPPSSGSQPGHGPSPESHESPPMYGMMPPKGSTRLPSGFADDRREQREPPVGDDGEGDFTYNEAEHEWEEILTALDTFAQALGRNFELLPPDVTTSISTPFGPALQYRTHTIAVVWGYYYGARILLHRLHPSMPPAMMMAAGMAAPTTAEYAQIVGRIAAGIYYPQHYNLKAGSLSPTLWSSLTEMTLPIFFAAVQYVDPAQRGWTIANLRDVSRLTGWKTSDTIASGCERAWIDAAKHGRGPPYERSVEPGRDHVRYPQDVLSRDEEAQHSDDRRFVTVKGADRARLAMGLLSLEEDMQNLEVSD